MTMHFYEPSQGHGLRHDPFNSIIAPRPVGWISTRDPTGRLNLAPYSFFNAFNYRPPILGLSSIGWKDTLANIDRTGAFIYNLVTRDLAERMNTTSASVRPDVDEFQMAGLTPAPGRIVNAPRVAESPVALECRLTQVLQLMNREGEKLQTWVVFGEVVGVHIEESLIRDGVYDTAAAHPVLRTGGAGGYAELRSDALFEMVRPG